jgi:endonuclease/exonuclease/phosphatase family metal-dependent hydrolase
MPPTDRTDRVGVGVVGGAAAVGLLFTEVLRVWIPTLVVVVGERPGAGITALAAHALTTLILAAALGLGLIVSGVQPRIVWLIGAAVLLGARLSLLSTVGGTTQLWTTTVAVAAGTVAVVALAAGAPRGDLARTGLISGAAASFALLAALGGVDLVWRTGPIARIGTILLVASAGLAVAASTRLLDAGPSSAALPWAAVGPATLLLAILGAPLGRVAVATGWTPARSAATSAAMLTLVMLTALLAVRLGPLTAGPTGAVLVLGGTAAALDAASSTAVLGQAALLAGVGAIMGVGPRGGGTSPRRRATVTGASLVLLGVLVLAYYAGHMVVLPYSNRSVLLMAALLLATSGLLSAVRSGRLGREPHPPALPGLVAAALIVGVMLTSVAAARSSSDPAPASDAQELRLVLANVHFGFDAEGRRRAREVAEVLTALEADLIVLNEVDRGWLVSGSGDLLGTYATATGMQAVFAPASDEMRGNAILTRLPVVEVSVERLPRGRDPLARSALTVVVELPDGERLAIVGTHLSDVDRQGDTRLPQAQAIAGIVARLRERGLEVVVAGDLNAGPGDPSFDVLAGLLERTLPDSVGTFPAAAPRVQIDHILVAPGWEALEARAFNTTFSDHRFVEVLVRRAALD